MVSCRSFRPFQSTLSLRRATLFYPLTCPEKGISIHALLAESDAGMVSRRDFGFISIHALLAESDCPGVLLLVGPQISIHALLAESDQKIQIPSNHTGHFNPRSPCGERHHPRAHHSGREDFNPRSPCGERRVYQNTISHCRHHFNPRSPCGERLRDHVTGAPVPGISIHALLAESD